MECKIELVGDGVRDFVPTLAYFFYSSWIQGVTCVQLTNIKFSVSKKLNSW